MCLRCHSEKVQAAKIKKIHQKEWGRNKENSKEY